MKRSSILLAASCMLALASACASSTPEPRQGPGPATSQPTSSADRDYTAADAAFLQGMIAHHAQALEMTALVPTRTTRPAIRLLAERITVSQQDEIARMQRWLAARAERVPSLTAHGEHGGAMHGGTGADSLMPGMLTARELERLAQTSGTDFDRLFLQFMIRHHEGALAMVARLFGTSGAAQEPEMFTMANDVDADQRAEIQRMQALLASLPAGGGAP